MNALKPPSGVGRSCLLLFGVVWTLVSCFFFAIPLASMIADPQRNVTVALPMGLFSLPFIAIGLGMVAYGIIPWITGMRISKPEVILSTTSIKVGENFTIGYSQTFKRRSEVKGVNFCLLMRETARYQQGKQRITVHHDETVAEFEYPGQIYEAGDVLTFSRSMEIPRNGMHTFQGVHNSIAWLLQVKVDVAGWPDYREEFEIRVEPTLAR